MMPKRNDHQNQILKQQLEVVLQQQQQQQQFPPETAPAVEPVVVDSFAAADVESSNSSTPNGTHQKQRMLLPARTDNGLNQQMAEAAAKRYEQDKIKIQKACAAMDDKKTKETTPSSTTNNPVVPNQRCPNDCCVIL